MISRLFPVARRATLPPRMMYLGMLLACFAWLLQMSPLLAPLWLKDLHAGHGICVELAPVITAQKHHSQHINHNQNHQNSSHHHHHLQNSSLLTTLSLDDGQHFATQTSHSNSKKSASYSHDCSICLAMMAFSLPASGFDLIVLLVLAFAILAAVLYRSLCQRLIVFLRPPSRASPKLYYCCHC